MVIKTNTGFGLDIDKLFDSMLGQGTAPSYPPYNVVKFDEDNIRMEFALAGFSREDVKVTTEKNTLKIVGEVTTDKEIVYLHKGIAARKFSRLFTLPEWFEVNGAGMDNGILYIDLKRNIPEEKKPKEITIK